MEPSTVWSVVVVARGMWETTQQCLDSLIATKSSDRTVQIFYADNGSPIEENSWNKFWGWMKKVIDDGRADVRLMAQGFDGLDGDGVTLSKCWNFGAQVTNGKYLLFCNNDIVFNQVGWMQEFEDGLNEDKIGAVGLIGMSWLQTPFIQGSLLATTREVWNKVGGFDERYLFTCEDVDWCRRMQEFGYSIKSYEHLRDSGAIFHSEGSTRNYYKDRTKEMQRRAHISRIEFCYKHTYPLVTIWD